MLGFVKALGAEYGDPENSDLFAFLCRVAAESREVAVALFWALKVEAERTSPVDADALIHHLLGRLPPSSCAALLSSEKLVNVLHTCTLGQEQFATALVEARIVKVSHHTDFKLDRILLEAERAIPLPLRPNAMCQEFDLSNLVATPSAHETVRFGIRVAEPLPGRPTEEEAGQWSGAVQSAPPPVMDVLSLMYKVEDMANDVVIEDVVRLMDVSSNPHPFPLVPPLRCSTYMLQIKSNSVADHRSIAPTCMQELINADQRIRREYGSIPIVTYDVMQIGSGAGLVNCVRAAKMVREIEKNVQSMKNWVSIEAKKFGDKKAFHANYRHSLAAWIVISYVSNAATHIQDRITSRHLSPYHRPTDQSVHVPLGCHCTGTFLALEIGIKRIGCVHQTARSSTLISAGFWAKTPLASLVPG
jgi:hypothetical protein